MPPSCLAQDLFSLASLQILRGSSAGLVDMVGNPRVHSTSLGALLWAGQKAEDHCSWLYSCWGCPEAFLLGQGLPVILLLVWTPSQGTMCLPLRCAGGTPCAGRKVIQPRSLGPDLHQHPIAFYSRGIGCGGAPAVQLWVMWTRAQKEAA